MDIQQKVIKDEIDIHDYFIRNMDVKQELNDEVSKAAFQNVNTNSMHLIKQEMNDDINTVQIFGESMVAAKTEGNSFHKVNIRKKFKVKPVRQTKSKGELQSLMDI